MADRRIDSVPVGTVCSKHASWAAGVSGPIEVVAQEGELVRCKLAGVSENINFYVRGDFVVVVDDDTP